MAKSIDEVSRNAIHALLTQVAGRLAISPFISHSATSREFFRTDTINDLCGRQQTWRAKLDYC
jgi:hypothetical protein